MKRIKKLLKISLTFALVLGWVLSPFAHLLPLAPPVKEAKAAGEALSQAHYRWRANNGGDGSATTTPTDWWDANFLSRRKIVFNNTPAGETLTNFPMPIKLTADANDEWSAANVDYSKTMNHGQDVRFVDSSGNMLKHEIENWDETSTSTAWVKVPTLTGTSTTDYIYMYYNNTSTTTSGEATSSVWSNSYTGVYHLTATSTAARKWDDSSGVTGTLTVTNANNSGVTVNATALLGLGVTFGGTDNDYMSKATAAFSSPPGTICSVYKTASTLNAQGIASVGGVDAAYHGIVVDGTTAGDPAYAETRNSGTSAKATTANGTTVGKWQYVCGTWTTSAQRNAILNAGAPVANTTNTSPTVTGTGIGLLFDGTPGSPANGTIDEVRFSNVARSTDWIQAEYRYGFASSTTHFFGPEERYNWWDTNFTERRLITLNNAPSQEDLLNFPVPVKLTEDANDEWGAANIDYSKTKNHGFDVRFVDAANSTMLKHEVEEWSETGTSTVWVKIPTLTAGVSTQVWMYYNNTSTTTSGAATSSVWDSNYKGVWHLNEDGNTTAGGYKDATSNANNGTGVSMTSSSDVTGPFSIAQDFDGTADYIDMTDIAALDSAAQTTYSAWVNRDTLGDFEALMSKRTGNTAAMDMLLGGSSGGWTNATDDVINRLANGADRSGYSTGNILPGTGKWHKWTLVFNGDATTDATSLRFFLNGKEITLTYSGTIPDTTPNIAASLLVGVASGGGYTDGKIDEVRVSNTARTADWVQQEYRYEAASSTTHSFGAEETIYSSTASFLVAEDTAATSQSTASTTRLRILMDETARVATTTTYQLEYATSTIVGYTSCSALSTWYSVAKTSSSSSATWKMSPSSHFAHRSTARNSSGLTDPTGSLNAGQLLDRAATTSPISLSAGNFTELEWAIQAGSDADGDSYCFRVTNADDTTNITYTKYARISMATSSGSTFTQKDYRLYENAAALNPSTAWDSLSENTAIGASNKTIGGGNIFRIRMNVTVGTANLSASAQAFTLQYAQLPSGACSALTSWQSIGSKGSNAAFALVDVASVNETVTITTPLLSSSDVGGSFTELTTSPVNPNAVNSGQEVEYDWPVIYPSARYSSADFCFRMVKAGGTAFSAYTNYPQIRTNTVGSGTAGAPVGGSAPSGAGTVSGGAGGSSSTGTETGGTPPAGQGQQGGGGKGGGSEVYLFIPFFKHFASVLTATVDVVAQFVHLAASQ